MNFLPTEPLRGRRITNFIFDQTGFPSCSVQHVKDCDDDEEEEEEEERLAAWAKSQRLETEINTHSSVSSWITCPALLSPPATSSGVSSCEVNSKKCKSSF